MATLLLPLAFEAGSGWAVAAGLVGAYIDNALIYPELFKTDPTYGPRDDGQKLGRWSEGAPIPRTFGESANVEGQVIFQSAITEVKETSSGGGKGGSGATHTIYKYYADVAVCFGEGPISRIRKIKADSKTLWEIAPDFDVSSTEIDGAEDLTFTYDGQTHVYHYFILYAPRNDTAPDLSELVAGKPIVFSNSDTGETSDGFDTVTSKGYDAINDRTWVRIFERLQNGQKSPVQKYSEFSSGTTTVFQDKPSHNPASLGGLKIHLGYLDAEPDSTLETHDGVGEVSAYRGKTYAVLRNLLLTDYGNRVPGFVGVVEEDSERLLVDVIQSILLDAGLDSGEFDLTGLDSTILVKGFQIPGPQETARSLQPLFVAYDILVQQVDSALRFFHREDATRVAIAAKFLAAGDGYSPIRVTETPQHKLSDEVTVDYLDSTHDFNQGSQVQRRNNNVSTVSTSMRLPLALSPQEAREVASRLLWVEWNSRFKVEFRIPAPEFVGKLREGDIAVFEALGETWEVLVEKIDRGADFMLEVQGRTEHAQTGKSIGEQVLELTVGDGDVASQRTPAYPFFMPVQVRPLVEKHLQVPGFYFAAASMDVTVAFRGAMLYESIDGENYDAVQVVEKATTFGTATTYTGADAEHARFDLANTITVEFNNGAPESVTELQLLNGANRAVWGDEIIGFQTATHVSGTTYTLTKLLRGLRGTEDKIDSAKSGNYYFAMLNGLHFHEVPSGAIGTSRYYKLVPGGMHPEEVAEELLTIEAMTVAPLPPAHLTKTVNGSNDQIFTWVPRTRSLSRIFGAQPTGEASASYALDIYDSTGTTFRRTITATTETATYTSAQQTTDGHTPGADLQVVISQGSAYLSFDAASPYTPL